MRSLIRFPHPANPNDAQPARLFWTVLAILALSFTAESLIEIFLLPANMGRWLLVIGVIDLSALLLFGLSRAGHLRLSGFLLVLVLWALVTWLAITENGVRSPTVDIAYLVTILVAGLVLDEQAGIITGVLCCLTLFVLSMAGIRGLLPESSVHRTILTTWEADVFYLAIVVGLQYLAIHAIRQALGKAHQELLERRRVETRLQKEHEERVQNQMRLELHRLLSEQLENERLKIARDLHDGPVQDLIGATFILQGLIEDAADDRQRQALQEVQSSLQAQVASLRAFAGDLRSPTLGKFGLEKAIREHLNNFHEKHPDMQVRLDASGSSAPLPEDICQALFRVYQEAIQNILRHAQATGVKIRLDIADHQARLEIEDNGVGFTPPPEWIELARRGHFGLVGMRERIETIGGRLEMASRPGQGTTIRVSAPVGDGADGRAG